MSIPKAMTPVQDASLDSLLAEPTQAVETPEVVKKGKAYDPGVSKGVIDHGGDKYEVPSFRGPGSYMVFEEEDGRLRCTCPAKKDSQGHCKYSRLVEEYIQGVNADRMAFQREVALYSRAFFHATPMGRDELEEILWNRPQIHPVVLRATQDVYAARWM